MYSPAAPVVDSRPVGAGPVNPGVGGSTVSRGAVSLGWRDQALCRWWPDIDWVGSSDPEIGGICVQCPVRRECARFAVALIDEGERLSGWWGGTFLVAPGTKNVAARVRAAAINALRRLAG